VGAVKAAAADVHAERVGGASSLRRRRSAKIRWLNFKREVEN
jgi:hypothetical protein